MESVYLSVLAPKRDRFGYVYSLQSTQSPFMLHTGFFSLRICRNLLCVILLPILSSTICLGQKLEYNRDVRPILSENCFACHGFDKSKREAGLRLDTAEGALAKLDSGDFAIQPRKPDESQLVKRVFASDDEVMPPHESGKRLTNIQKGILKSWVEQGARYDKHWAFIAPKKTEPRLTAITSAAFWTRRMRTMSFSSPLAGRKAAGFSAMALTSASLRKFTYVGALSSTAESEPLAK